jgi:putative molybdopterin biosynthesis protein
VSKKNEFLDLISPEKALQIINENFIWVPKIENIYLEDALGRILAENIIAKIDVPPFDRSRMDGYAVRSSNTYEIDEVNPRIFKVVDTLIAGDIPKTVLEKDFSCIEIATGAPIPPGANAVVMVENTSKISDNEVQIFRGIPPQENIEFAGSDIMFGETVLYQNDEITPVRLGILSSLGISKIPVFSKMKIGVISTGDELTEPGNDLPYGNIYDSNSLILLNLIKEAGFEPIDLGICKDDLKEYFDLLSNNLKNIDLLLISGGTSAGEGDYSYRIISEMGGSLLFHGVSMKPGKPVAVGLIDKKLIIILPGFPASAIFSYNTLVAPLLNRVSRNKLYENSRIKAKLGQKMLNTSGRTEFKLIFLMQNSNELTAFPIKATSGSITALEKADGYITIFSTQSVIEEGNEVEVILFKNFSKIPDLVFVGSHDFRVNILINKIKEYFPQINTKLLFTGSTGGLMAISQEKCDLCAIHLFDSETDSYNNSFVESFGIKDKVKFLEGYVRTQGLFIPKGNPKNISTLDDLLRDDVTFLNRNEGSGTRILLDHLLMKLAEEKKIEIQQVTKNINGYDTISSSHSAAASSVQRGLRDVSVGIKEYVKQYDLDFIPLKNEHYDFLIRKSSLKKFWVKKFISMVESKNFDN